MLKHKQSLHKTFHHNSSVRLYLCYNSTKKFAHIPAKSVIFSQTFILYFVAHFSIVKIRVLDFDSLRFCIPLCLCCPHKQSLHQTFHHNSSVRLYLCHISTKKFAHIPAKSVMFSQTFILYFVAHFSIVKIRKKKPLNK